MKLHRVQVVLEEDEWAEVQRLAHRLALIRGRRVSASEALKELVARGLHLGLYRGVARQLGL